MVYKHIRLLPARNHRVPRLEYPFLGAQNDFNSDLICSSFTILFPQPHPRCSKTCGSSLAAQTMLIKFEIPTAPVHVLHNTRIYAETSRIFCASLSLYRRQLVLDAVAPSISIQEVDPTHCYTIRAHVKAVKSNFDLFSMKRGGFLDSIKHSGGHLLHKCENPQTKIEAKVFFQSSVQYWLEAKHLHKVFRGCQMPGQKCKMQVLIK